MSEVLEIRNDMTANPLVGAEARTGRSTVMVGGVPIGPNTFTLIAGPCAVETPDQTLKAAQMARRGGAALLRGGAFKPRTSPYAFSGLGREGLLILSGVRAEIGLPFVTEVLDTRDVDLVATHADMLQIGARNMQNFALLRAVGSIGLPVLLKRGCGATIDEWLAAAEYVAQAGTEDIVLCERGIRTFESSTRNTLDVSAVPVVQSLSHLPVIIDPSHAAGRRDLVLPLGRAGAAVGADGLLVELHPDPSQALCDGPQALAPQDMKDLRALMQDVPLIAGRLSPAEPGVSGRAVPVVPASRRPVNP